MNILINVSFHLPAVEESSLLHADSGFPCLILDLPDDRVSTTALANLIIKQQSVVNLMTFSLIPT